MPDSMTDIQSPATHEDRRVFLGLDQPPIVSAAEWLIGNFRNPTSADLADALVVLPTRRAGQRLLQLLVQHAESQQLELRPPLVTSVGQLPEFLYVAEKKLASDLAQQIAWGQALAAMPAEEISHLTGRDDADSLDDWQPLAKLLSRLHRRLGNDIWSFSSVLREVQKIPAFLDDELKRWQVLDAVQKRYYRLLNEVDLWDRQAARSVAVKRGLCATDKRVIMVCAADLSRSVTGMLEQIDQQVSILVAADQADADHFDRFGTLITDQWLERTVHLRDEQITIVDQPADQGFAVSHLLSKWSGESPLAADQVTVGVPDPAVIPQIERGLNSIDARHRNLAGKSLAETAPVRLMIACRDYIRTQDYFSLATLVRHPDMYELISARMGSKQWLGDLDEYQTSSLPNRLSLSAKQPFGDPDQIITEFESGDESSARRAERRAAAVQRLNRMHQLIAAMLSPLAGGDRPIAEWSRPWSQVLIDVYSEREMDSRDVRDRQTIKACDEIYSALGDHRQVPDSWPTEMSAVQALNMAIEAASETRVVDPPVTDAVELAGWLDLILDDAPVVIITGMNDEHVPTSEFGHQFLPNMLCEMLKIEDNNRRYARDVYALNIMAAVREKLILITGRRDEQGEPRKPSRLLFATDPDTAAHRARAFFSYGGKSESRIWLGDQATFRREQQFKIPHPLDSKPIELLPVTQFKVFLKCPYRFYLTRVMRLESVDDELRELDGGLFGDLAHDVLQQFGEHKIRHSDDTEEISEFLLDTLNTEVGRRFSGSRLPAISIQIENLRQRLTRFAVHQADYRRDGWLIASTEEMLYATLDVDGQPFRIRGKIDRVDRNENDNRVAVWDYKTSDSGDPPSRAHFNRNKGWVDLQLPLYRYLVQSVEAVRDCDLSNVGLGYILLPKALDKIGFAAADWNREFLKTADSRAFEVIRELRETVYWPPNPEPPPYSEDLAPICMDGVFERPELEDSSAAEAPF